MVERIFAPRNKRRGISKGVRLKIKDLPPKEGCARLMILRSQAPTIITVKP